MDVSTLRVLVITGLLTVLLGQVKTNDCGKCNRHTDNTYDILCSYGLYQLKKCVSIIMNVLPFDIVFY